MRGVFAVLFLLLFAGCGGGTSSTGDPGTILTKSVQGRVVDSSNAVFPGMIVRDDVSGNETVCDNNGNFQIDAALEDDSIKLIFEFNSNSSQATISDVPLDSITVIAEFKVNQEEGLISVVSVEYQTRPETSSASALPADRPALGQETSSASALPADTPAPEDTKDKDEDKTYTPTSPSPTPKPTIMPTPSPTPYSLIIHHLFWEGTVKGPNGRPVSGVQIEVSSGESVSTNSNGRFSLVTETQSQSFRLKISYNCTSDEIELQGLPDGRDATVRLELQLAYLPSEHICYPISGMPSPHNSSGFVFYNFSVS